MLDYTITVMTSSISLLYLLWTCVLYYYVFCSGNIFVNMRCMGMINNTESNFVKSIQQVDINNQTTNTITTY